MQLTSIACVIAVLASAMAAPTGESEIVARTNPKINQYPKGDCKDNSGGNTPIYHSSPPARRCVNVDPATVSIYWTTGSTLTQAWAYSKAGCTGNSFNMQGSRGPCVAVDQNISNDFKNIRSIMMD